ncbi:phasin family protein [Oceanobacillus oncorhynchi]|uniref:phasin family protein n=1 Tax=Oceanobacillus oncorhynchi TaxID=545501 RepID=UPI0036D2D568
MMSDYLRKGFLLGLGAAVSGKEKFEQKVKELVEKNELTQEQARTVLDNFIEKGSTKKDEWDERSKEKKKDLARETGLATTDDIDELRARIIVLEDKLGVSLEEEADTEEEQN